MGMQVHFNLNDVIYAASVTISKETTDNLAYFIGTINGPINGPISFKVEYKGDFRGDACWADITHDRAIVNWLIDQRIPFNAS